MPLGQDHSPARSSREALALEPGASPAPVVSTPSLGWMVSW